MNLLQTAIGTSSAASFFISPELVFFGLLKLFFIAGAVLYVIFAGLVVRQIDLMKKTITTGPSTVMVALGFIHFLVAILVLLLFILIL